MPRQAHGRPIQSRQPDRPRKRKQKGGIALNALEIAEQQNPEQTKIRQHRLGEIEEDSFEREGQDETEDRASKRQKVNNSNDGESEDGGSDLEGNSWHVGVNDEDEDSDIDSEDAFGDSDEERFAGFTFRGSESQENKPRRGKSRPDISLSEADQDIEDNSVSEADDEDDDLGEDAVDLAAALDMNEEDDRLAPGAQKKKRPRRLHHDVREADSESETEDDFSDADSEESVDEEEDDMSISDAGEGDHNRLQRFVENLVSSSKTTTGPKKGRDFANYPDKPMQFGLGPSKISLSEVLQYVKDPQQRKSLRTLQDAGSNGTETYTKGIPGKLSVPLAKRQQDKIDRVAAYDQSKQELAKWIDTIKQNRRAEHISFPLQDHNSEAVLSTKQLGPISQSQPITSLESAIQDIMKESGLVSKDHKNPEDAEQKYEELQEQKLSLEEVQARRAELRKARDLMFREEIRAKRIKKIKSKAYRRIHRKERDKANLEQRALLAAQGLLDSDQEREQNDRRRAEERMGARHRESKWAKGAKSVGRAAWDEDARTAVSDLAKRDEELRRRVEGKATRGSDVSDIDDESEDSDSRSEISNEDLQNEIHKLEGDDEEAPYSKLSSMAFMKKAEAARKTANDEDLQALRDQLHEDDPSTLINDDDPVPQVAGRQQYGIQKSILRTRAKPKISKSEFEERMSDDNDDDADELIDAETQAAATGGKRQQVQHILPSTIQKKQNNKAQRTVAIESEKSKKGPGRSNDEPKKLGSKTSRKEQNVQTPLQSHNEYENDSNDEDDGPATLAEAIFAGSDDIIRDFESEKQQTIQEEGDQVIDNGLPGWGSWAGAGISKRQQKRDKGRFLTTIKGVSEDKRQDKKLERVIVNEKIVKKNSKYLATELPHPFESRQQYERSLRLPLGPEWTTKTTFQDATKPRVLVKQGVIRPMARPTV